MTKNLVQELEMKFEEAKQARSNADARWNIFAAFLFGKQWSLYDQSEKKLVEQKAPTWRARVVANMIFPIVRIIISKIVRQDFSVICSPLNKSEKDKSAARVGTQVIKYVFEKNKIKKLAYEVAINVLTYGISYLKTYFDTTEYADIPLKEDRQPMAMGHQFSPDDRGVEIIHEEQALLDEAADSGEVPPAVSDAINITGDMPPLQFEQFVSKPVKIGDVVIESLRPDFVYIDPLATSVEDARYAFIVKVRSREYIQSRYGFDLEEQEVILPSGQDSIDGLVSPVSRRNQKGILVKEYFERPNNDYPDGRHIVIANDKVVKGEQGDEANSYAKISPSCAIPLSQFNYFTTMNNLFTTSLVEQLIPLQKEYNRLRSDIVEHERLLMRGKWFIPTTSNVSQQSLTSEPGEKVYFDPRGGPPIASNGVPPPPAIWNHIQAVKNEFNDIAGIHEVSKGRVPSGVRSAAGIMFLQEQDDIQLSVTNALLQEGFLDVARKVVDIAAEYYKEDRLLKITGKGTQIEIVQFKEGVMRKGSFDVVVEFGSKVPYSFVARQQFVLSLVDRGLIQDRERIMRLLEFSTEDELFESTEYDELNARTENQSMSQGQMVMVNDYDDHMRHMKIHDAFRKNPDFKMLPQEIQEIFFEHINFHKKFIATMMAQMQEQQEEQKKTKEKPQE